MTMDAGMPDTDASPLLTTISEDPLVRESIVDSLDTHVTPTESFYVRNHFTVVPEIDPDKWRLKVEGLVNTSLELTFDELLGLPSVESVVTLECAGNSRSYLTPPAEGIAFAHGAVSTARWKGVPLAEVLKRSGVAKDAIEVVFHGADTGEEEEDGVVYSTELPYQRSLPVDTAMRPEMLLAYEMNGEPLTPDHGFPLRLLVPRWYGMASVKWLTHIEVVDKPFRGVLPEASLRVHRRRRGGRTHPKARHQPEGQVRHHQPTARRGYPAWRLSSFAASPGRAREK